MSWQRDQLPLARPPLFKIASLAIAPHPTLELKYPSVRKLRRGQLRFSQHQGHRRKPPVSGVFLPHPAPAGSSGSDLIQQVSLPQPALPISPGLAWIKMLPPSWPVGPSAARGG
ncbi:unnamed protein product [Rangifer tarandus platyrhynchus]|uniref:Uncharacterized protein n=2 Tax=Rangifer tarandus platyrhynchus TaxID=3082113 RepID=A0ABN8YQ79_RANTA|nr:unnamed protein product [Rangifer tarandus platyrhynchus]